MRPILLLCCLLARALTAGDAPVFDIADLRRLIDQAKAEKPKTLVIPPGIYRGAPAAGKKVHLDFDRLADLEIVADGVTLICTKATRAIDFRGCKNVSLRGLTIDYDPITFTQGKVAAVAADGNSIDVKLGAGYPQRPFSRIDVVDPATRHRKKGMPFLWGTKAEMVAPDTVRVSLKNLAATAPVGTLISLSNGNDPDGICHGVALERCGGGMVLKNVTIHCAPGMGLVEHGGAGGTHIDGLRIVPGPRPTGATEARLLTTSWDGILHSTVRKGPTVENCVIEDCGDDTWSVQSSDYLVLHREGDTLILAQRSGEMMLESGDHLRQSLTSPEWRIEGIKPVKRLESGVPPEILAKLDAAKPFGFWKLEAKDFVIATMEKRCDLAAGQSVYSQDRQGCGFTFKNNTVRSSGRILIKAGLGLIENNKLYEPHGIVLCPEVPAGAAAGIKEVLIRGNLLVDSSYSCQAPWSSQAGALSLSLGGEGNALRGSDVFERIMIEGNTFRNANGLNLCISSATSVFVRNNSFVSALTSSPNSTGSRYGIAQDSVVWVGQSRDVRFTENIVVDLGPNAKQVVSVAPSVTEIDGTEKGFVISKP